MKAFLIEYETNGRDFRKIVELEDNVDMEKYILSNYSVYSSVFSRLNKKVFQRAREIKKNECNRWCYVPRGEYWYCKVISMLEKELVKGTAPDNSSRVEGLL